MYAGFWVLSSRDRLIFYSLAILPRWLEVTQYVAPLLLGGFCEGKLIYVCTFYFDANVGDNVNLQLGLISVHFIMNICFMDQLLKWLISHPLQLFILLFSCWVVLVFVSQLANIVLWLFFLWVFAEYALLLGFWHWWQVPFELIHSIQSPAWRLSFHFHLDQHVNMLRLHPWMPAQPLLGGRTILWLYFLYGTALLFADIVVSIFVLPVSWTFSYFLLSLNMACKLAHEFVGLPTGWCWQLGLVPSFRDEVKEKCPIVNEDTFSETKSSLPIFVWLVFGWSSQEGFQMFFNIIPLWHELKHFSQAYAATFDVNSTFLAVIVFGPYFVWNCCIQGWFSWAPYVAIVIVLCIKGLVDQLNNPRFFLRRSGKCLLLYFIF